MKRGRVRLALEAVAESGGMKREAVRLAPEAVVALSGRSD